MTHAPQRARMQGDPAARLGLLALAIDQAAEAVMVCDAEGCIGK